MKKAKIEMEKDIDTKHSLSFYKNLKRHDKGAPYTQQLTKNLRKAMATFRLGLYMYKAKQGDIYVCKLCNMVLNPSHLIEECPTMMEERKEIFSRKNMSVCELLDDDRSIKSVAKYLKK